MLLTVLIKEDFITWYTVIYFNRVLSMNPSAEYGIRVLGTRLVDCTRVEIFVLFLQDDVAH